MPFGQLNVAIQIYNICKGRLGSRGGRGCISERRRQISDKNRPLCTMVVFIVHQLYVAGYGFGSPGISTTDVVIGLFYICK